MASTYPSVSRWLEENNWMRLDSLKKWIHKAREI
jgi:pyruvate/oxaloacetate carboxyltransferase